MPSTATAQPGTTTTTATPWFDLPAAERDAQALATLRNLLTDQGRVRAFSREWEALAHAASRITNVGASTSTPTRHPTWALINDWLGSSVAPGEFVTVGQVLQGTRLNSTAGNESAVRQVLEDTGFVPHREHGPYTLRRRGWLAPTGSAGHKCPDAPHLSPSTPPSQPLATPLQQSAHGHQPQAALQQAESPGQTVVHQPLESSSENLQCVEEASLTGLTRTQALQHYLGKVLLSLYRAKLVASGAGYGTGYGAVFDAELEATINNAQRTLGSLT